MPTYQYRCTDCAHELEVVQKFTDDALTVCPDCHGQLRKVFSAVGVVFKGSGFYSTDSRTKGTSTTSKAASPAAAPTDSSPAAPASDSATSGSASATTPAAPANPE